MAKKAKGKSKTVKPIPPAPLDMDPEDDDLMNDLLAQLDSRDTATQQESATVLNEMHLGDQADQIETKSKSSAKERFQARKARKAAALAQNIAPGDPEVQARIEAEARAEEKAILDVCQDYNRQMVEINPDGHCLYSAVADQLASLGILSPDKANYVVMRTTVADFIEHHSEDFLPFLPSVEGEDAAGALDGGGLMSPQEFRQYCSAVRSTAVWGGEPEIQALSKAFNIPIYVVQGGIPPVVIHDPTGSPDKFMKKLGVWVSYHRRMYGLGEHYNSLRPAPV